MWTRSDSYWKLKCASSFPRYLASPSSWCDDMYVSPVVTAFTTLSPMSYLHPGPGETETESGKHQPELSLFLSV